GTALLAEFLSFAATTTEKSSLAIAAPFIGPGIGHELAAWQSLPHELLDLHVVTKNERSARIALREIGGFRWQSIPIATLPRLHAKLYALLGARGGCACLIGSHNLTLGGARVNDEAGVLFSSINDKQVSGIVRACHERIIHLGSQG